MTDRTPFADLTRYDPSDPLSADGYSLQDRNVRLTDYFLRLLFNPRGDGHAALADPALDLAVATDVAGGQIPSDLSITVGYTLLDADGGETALSPLQVIATAAGLEPPVDGPVLVYDQTAGTLLANTYTYALTLIDGVGGETAMGPATTIVVPAGAANSRVMLSGISALATVPGSAGWRLWRSIGGDDFALIATGVPATDAVVDDGSLDADCGVSPPSATGTTRSTNTLRVTVPGGQPVGTAQFRIYAAIDGDFSGPSLLGTYPAVDLATEKLYTELAFLASSPPERSLTMADTGGGGGGGGGLFSYPVDWSHDFTVDDFTMLNQNQALVLIDNVDGPIALMYDGVGQVEVPFPYTRIRNFDASTTESLGLDFFITDPAPGMRDGTATTRFQLGATDFEGSVSTFIGFRRGLRTYARLFLYDGGPYYLSVGTEDAVEGSSDEAASLDVSATVVLAADTDYWLSVTRDGEMLSAAIYDADPALGAAALAEIAPTVENVRAYDFKLRTNAAPGFGWRMQDPTARGDLVRVFGMAAHAASGGDGYQDFTRESVTVADNGNEFAPVRRVNFVNFAINDERPAADQVTITAPGLPSVGLENFGWAGALGSYLNQNVTVEDTEQRLKATLAGDDGRLLLAPAPGLWTELTRGMFFGIEADDKFGVIIKGTDIDSYIAARVNNATGAPLLEIVDNNNGVETVLKSVPITQLLTTTPVGVHWWDLPDPIWVVGEIALTNGTYVKASIYDAQPDMETAAPLYHVGTTLVGTVRDRYTVAGDGGVLLNPDAGGTNSLRVTEFLRKGEA